MKQGGFASWETPDLVAKRDFLLEKRTKRLSHPEQRELAIIEELLRQRGVIQAKVDALLKPPALENELNNAERLASAIEEAKRLGLVVTEEGGDLEGSNHAFLLPSGHYGGDRLPSPDIRQSQYQLFALMHLLEKHGASSALYPEGLQVGDRPSHSTIVNVGPLRNLNILDPRVQEYFFRHPEEYKAYLDWASQRRIHQAFFSTTSYPHLHGIHQRDVWQRGYLVYPKTALEASFPAKYVGPQGIQPQAQMMNGRWVIVVKNRMLTPREVADDCDAFLAYERELAEYDTLREQEVAACFEREAGKQPLAWIGMGHEKEVLRHCKDRHIHVTSVIPTSMVADRLRGVGGDLAKQNAPAIRQVRDWVAQYLQ